MESAQQGSVEERRAATDAVLCDRVRHGDGFAFTELYTRHYEGGIKYAVRLVRDRQDAEDLLSEAFARTLDVLKRGKGPTESFRAYLNMVLRNLHIKAADANTVALPDDADNYLSQLQEPDSNEKMGERELIYVAFTSLPERWQSVLWSLEVEGLDLSEVGEQIGMRPNAVAQLALRARDGLKIAYLTLHTEQAPAGDCKAMSEKLARYVRGQAGKRDSVAVRKHLETCADCRQSVKWMSDVGHQMRSVVAPIILGGSGIGLASWSLGSSGSAASAAVLAPAAIGISGGAKLAIVGASALVAAGAIFGGIALMAKPEATPQPSATSIEPSRVVTESAPTEKPVTEPPAVEAPAEVAPEPAPEPAPEVVPEVVPPVDTPNPPETPNDTNTPNATDTTDTSNSNGNPAPTTPEDDTTPGWELAE
ncbi:sigma-70 family RNA polymerase sigma factor [Leucobacter viscericola]|uniref:Sigma-70 family RNA polymerase sigma factor n=1 Tax=Leucobacter viscericola TaxID=2714935 RepID=A0A6G7XI99_9MICO|nr:sigma-70 family RNA polymerase sigma factor [Leucobacter viscericola]QIK64169.1 sigma-70 family RNA polymerase sigma factor [Leucobacter viscericola]